MTDIRTLSSEAFVPLIGTSFALQHDSGEVLELTVKSVTEKPAATPRDAPRIAFSVILTAPEPCPFGDCDITVPHPTLGLIGPVHITRIHPGTATSDVAVFQLIFG